MKTPIAFLGVELATPALDITTDFYVDHFGLDALLRDEAQAVLIAAGAETPTLILRHADAPRLTALRYAYPDQSALNAARNDAIAEHLSPIDEPGGFSILSPDGLKIIFTIGPDVSARQAQPACDRPLFMSHIVVNSGQPDRLVAFFRDQLGFMVSDRYEKGLLTFLKCAQPQHHCIGVAPAQADGVNHFAMDCGTIDALMRGVSRMSDLGHKPIWGPGRHGPGGNIFCYFEDPNGFVAEYTCELIQIPDDTQWRPRDWVRNAENGNVWLSGGPSPRAAVLMGGDVSSIANSE